MSYERVAQFFDMYNIPIAPAGHTHFRNSWVNICCPFCVDTDYHLGYNTVGGYFSCYRCGYKNTVAVIHELASCGVVEAKRLQRLFFKGASANASSSASASASSSASASASASILPSSGDITRNLVAYTYLRKRFKHLSAEAFKNMIKTYGITYTDEMYRDRWKYRSRIIFPNILCGKVVSFQTRSYNQNARIKYLTADPTEEVVPHKSFLWGIDWVPFNKIIVTEGVMDALTIGAGAVHTHGVNFTQEQVQCLYPFDHVFIAYDMDDAGCTASKALASALSHRTKVTRIRLSQHDVNSCSEQEIKEIQGVLK